MPFHSIAPRDSRFSLTWVTMALAVYVSLALNLPEFIQRGGELVELGWKVAVALLFGEILMVFGASLSVMALAAMGGRISLWLLGTLVLLLSAACVHYMVRFDVVIGYGIVQAALGQDQTLSGEIVEGDLVIWVMTLGLLPAAGLSWYMHRHRALVLKGQWQRNVAAFVAGLMLCLAANKSMAHASKNSTQTSGVGKASVTGLVAHRYVPTNWISGLGMMLGNSATTMLRASTLEDPAKKFTYVETTPLDDVTVVLVIGETARYDHMGLFGYARDTTPRLSSTPNLAAFRAKSCDTVTTLSLACMFVRPEGVQWGDGFSPDVVREEMVFSVFRRLGFTIDLFAMQAEAGFYHQVGPDFYKLREVIAGQAGNGGAALDGMLLPEVKTSLQRRPVGRHLIVLHMKGSHHQYSKRYPRLFARWQPECMGTEQRCSREMLVNAYDNSLLYTDHVLAELTRMLEGRKALMIYTSDHGESIDEGGHHLHGTPRAIAPPEQRRVPMLFWASGELLADPTHRQTFEQMRARQLSRPDEVVVHQHLFASMLGCLSIQSEDGGLTEDLNLCQAKPPVGTALLWP